MKTALKQKKHSFRFFYLATSNCNIPELRVVVLRDYDSKKKEFTIYSDARSQKVLSLENNKNVKPYNSIIKYKNIQHAICKVITNNNIIFSHFHPTMTEHFLKNYDSIINNIQEYRKENNKCTLNTTIYRMETYIDYDSLEKKLSELIKTLNGNKKTKTH